MHIATGLSNLLSQTGFIHLDLAIEASAADDETKQNLKKMQQRGYDKHKHRDVNITTSINYSMARNGNRVNSFIISK